jgi:hypothetical protein
MSKDLAALHTSQADTLRQLSTIFGKELMKMSAQMDALQAAVEKNTVVNAGAVELIKGIAAQLIVLKQDPVRIQAYADELNQKSDVLAAAILENTPAEPPA